GRGIPGRISDVVQRQRTCNHRTGSLLIERRVTHSHQPRYARAPVEEMARAQLHHRSIEPLTFSMPCIAGFVCLSRARSRLPQVNGIAAFGNVALRLAESGAVGTWLGTGSSDLRHEGGRILAIRIEDDVMALEVGQLHRFPLLECARFATMPCRSGLMGWPRRGGGW